MTNTNASFTSEEAPCGQVVDGECHQDRDDDCMLTDDRFYACGCRVTRHEYHDGSFSRRVTHHNGKILVDNMNSEHHA